MLANLGMCGASIFNGHFQNMNKVVDYNNETCGNGTNADYPCRFVWNLDLYYPSPCDGKLDTKICVKQCPNSADINNYNSLVETSST